MLYIDPEEYSMCSQNSRELAEVLVNYIYWYCCDLRAYNYYPLLDNINEWIVTTYGEQTPP